MGLEYAETAYNSNTALDIPPEFFRRHGMPMGHLKGLSALRKRMKLTQADLAEMIGVGQPTIQRWESGKREPDLDQLVNLALTLGVEPSALIDQNIAAPLGPRLYVKGDVAAGLWRPAFEWPEDDWLSFNGRADVVAERLHRFGLRVVGDSMDRTYPDGTIVECVSLFGSAEAVPGKNVVVVRTNDNGEVEATVKKLVESEGELWLVPDSTNPAHLPIKMSEPEPGIAETRIVAVVVASIRPE
jgi:transcriptional regulator with XRE-family HTH domain